MSYTAAIDQLSAMTPELLTHPGQARRKFSLGEVRTLLGALGNPHLGFRSVLIAGTNGKGSTAATLASILEVSGLRTGLYTSPHLTRPNERIRLNGGEIGDEEFARLYFKVHDCGQRLVLEEELKQLPSFFETLTAMAFLYFAEQAVDVAVLEVGMGGRLDATNVVEPLLSVITDISLDHTEWLGPTIAAIAREKAGILREGGTLVTLPQHPEANQAIGEAATDLHVRGVNAAAYMPGAAPRRGDGRAAGESGEFVYTIEALGETITVASPLAGEHQHRNVALAVAAAVELAEQHKLPVTARAVEEGIRATQWPGRFERLTLGEGTAGVRVVLDVAHNPAGVWALRAALRSVYGLGEREATRAVLVFGCLRDKPFEEMARILFPLFEEIIFAPIHSPRATPVEEMLAAAEAMGIAARGASSVAEALEWAMRSAETARGAQSDERSGLMVVAGSVYLVGAARPLLLARTGER